MTIGEQVVASEIMFKYLGLIILSHEGIDRDVTYQIQTCRAVGSSDEQPLRYFTIGNFLLG